MHCFKVSLQVIIDLRRLNLIANYIGAKHGKLSQLKYEPK